MDLEFLFSGIGDARRHEAELAQHLRDEAYSMTKGDGEHGEPIAMPAEGHMIFAGIEEGIAPPKHGGGKQEKPALPGQFHNGLRGEITGLAGNGDAEIIAQSGFRVAHAADGAAGAGLGMLGQEA